MLAVVFVFLSLLFLGLGGGFTTTRLFAVIGAGAFVEFSSVFCAFSVMTWPNLQVYSSPFSHLSMADVDIFSQL